MQSRYSWPHHTVNITAIFQCIMLLIQWTLSMLNTGRYPSCRLGAFYVESDVLWSKLKSLDEILWCGHSKETSSAVLSHGTIFKPLHPCFPIVLLFFLTKPVMWPFKRKLLLQKIHIDMYSGTPLYGHPLTTDTRIQWIVSRHWKISNFL